MSKWINIKNLFLIILTITTLLSLGILGCAAPERIDIDTPQEEIPLPPEEAEEEEFIEEEPIDLIEEEVDYESASVGAELEGFIPGYLCVGKENRIKINITNTSDFTWRSDGENMVRIGYHYYHIQETRESYDNPTRSPLPENVEPGETVSVEVIIDNIDTVGNYVIRIDPVLEGYFWFSSKGVEMIEGEAYFGECTN